MLLLFDYCCSDGEVASSLPHWLYGSLPQAPTETLWWLPVYCPLQGVLTLYVALTPDVWLPHADRVRSAGWKFLLAFALTGWLMVTAVFRFFPPAAFQRAELVYPLYPACRCLRENPVVPTGLRGLFHRTQR